jgi:hypothetical protein
VRASDLPELDRGLFHEVQHLATMLFESNENLRPFAVIRTETEAIIYTAQDDTAWIGRTDEVVESKKTFYNTVRAISWVKNSLGVAYATEAWSVSLPSKEDEARFWKWREENPEASFEDFDLHVELLVIHVETDSGRTICHLPIHRAANKHPWLDPINPDLEVTFEPLGSDAWKRNTQGSSINLFIPTKIRKDDEAEGGELRQLAQLYVNAQGLDYQPLPEVKGEDLKPRKGAN